MLAHHAQPIPKDLILELAPVRQASLIITEFAQNALLDLSGAQPQASASMSAVKMQLIPKLLELVFVTVDLDSTLDHAKHAQIITSSPTDIALLVQLTLTIMLLPRDAIALLDSSPTNGVFVKRNAEQTKFTLLTPKDVHASKDLEELMEFVKCALQVQPLPQMDHHAQSVVPIKS